MQRHVAEEQVISTPVRFVIERTFNLDPLNRVAGDSIFGRKWVDVLLIAAVHARAEQSHRIRGNAFARNKGHVQIGNGGLRSEITGSDRSALSEPACIDADRLVVASRPDFIQLRSMPKGEIINRRFLRALTFIKPATNSAAADPDGVAGQFDVISARGRSAEDTGYLADRFALTGCRCG